MLYRMATPRRVTKERTRQKLIDATLRVLHEHGPGALTTGRIANAAGLAQPTFYVHFSDMEDALTAAAAAVEERLLVRLREYRSELSMRDPETGVRNVFRATVKALMAEPQLTQLYLRHRHDVDSPLGRRFRDGTQRARRELAEDLAALGIPSGVAVTHAEAVVGMTLGIVEALIEGRLTDRDAAVEALVHICTASLHASSSAGLAATPA
jgi:TetR/AcrR family transcriptional regulator, fatty acid biosynthesis regulator